MKESYLSMSRTTRLILPLIILSLTSCTSKVYKDKSFFSKAKPASQTLAVLPAEVIYTGNLPKNWDADRLAKVEAEQSLKIQESVQEKLLFHAKNKNIRGKWNITVMDYRSINNKLEEKGISLKDSWKIPSSDLTAILGADMLIRTRVQNERIMSEAAAAGINVGVSVLRDVLSSTTSSPVYLPRAKASDYDMSLSLYHSSRPEAVARVASDKKLRVRKLPVYVKN